MTKSFNEIVQDTLSFFELRENEYNEEYYVLKDSCTVDLYNMVVLDCHNDEFANSWVYEAVRDILIHLLGYEIEDKETISDNGWDNEIVNGLSDVSSYDLLSFYRNNNTRLSEADDNLSTILNRIASNDFLEEREIKYYRSLDINDLLRFGYEKRLYEIFAYVVDYIEEIYQDQF